jgi:glycyl-tRNA synthetase beta chain
VLAFKALPACAGLAAANKRIRNILRKATESGIDLAALPPVDAARLRHEVETGLYAALQAAESAVLPRFAAGDYVGGLSRLAELHAPIDAFFEGVMVMAEDEVERNTRLALLHGLSSLFLRVADISLLAS